MQSKQSGSRVVRLPGSTVVLQAIAQLIKSDATRSPRANSTSFIWSLEGLIGVVYPSSSAPLRWGAVVGLCVRVGWVFCFEPGFGGPLLGDRRPRLAGVGEPLACFLPVTAGPGRGQERGVLRGNDGTGSQTRL